jgi:hypothetical protein
MKDGEFLDDLGGYQLVKKDPASWSYFVSYKELDTMKPLISLHRYFTDLPSCDG